MQVDRREFLGAAAGGIGLAAAKNRGLLKSLSRSLDPGLRMQDVGLEPDPWQRQVLMSRAERLMLLCCRQSGKSTVTASLALNTALDQPGSLVLLLSPSLRQSGELFRKVVGFYEDLGRPVAPVQETATTLQLKNDSRIVSLPGTPDTVRGYSGVRLLVIDEAAITSDELFAAVNPMLAVSRGRMVALSTPLGQRGWFYDAWEREDKLWQRIKVTAWDCPRISRRFLDEQRQILSERHFRQEYECSFEETVGQIFSTESINAAFDPEFAGFGYEDFSS